jgi:hypothetical protein
MVDKGGEEFGSSGVESVLALRFAANSFVHLDGHDGLPLWGLRAWASFAEVSRSGAWLILAGAATAIICHVRRTSVKGDHRDADANRGTIIAMKTQELAVYRGVDLEPGGTPQHLRR